MRPMLRLSGRLAFVLAATWLALCEYSFAQATGPKRILIVHSFGRDFAPYDAITSAFRSELAKALPNSIALLETTLDAGREVTKEEEQAFLEYLRARFSSAEPDLVITIGPPAARFYLAHRANLFSAPLIMAALDERLARGAALRPGDAAVTGKVELPRLFENIFQLLPDTTTIAVVIGSSRLEQFWLSELKKEVAPFERRARFEWLSDLSLEQMKVRLAAMPPNSAVLYGLLIVDAAGVPYERQAGLNALHAVSAAPIFGLYESELGHGVVGGPYFSQWAGGEQLASAAERVLREAPAAEPARFVQGFEPPVYDWRELRRWNIDTERLPPGSEIRFRPPSTWEEHRSEIIVAGAVMALQSALIAALIWQRRRRRHAEREARSLSGRLITAHEDERRHLARELHDDLTQRLAALAIQASNLETVCAGPGDRNAATVIRDRLVELSEDVHALSYRLHPTVIEDLGLVEALRAECDRVASSGPMAVSFETGAVPARLPTEVAVGLFRVAQAALRNVARHAQASEARVTLGRDDHRLTLVVQDNGVGFEKTRKAKGASLGIASMRERMRLLGGKLDVASAMGRGTTVTASVPLPESA